MAVDKESAYEQIKNNIGEDGKLPHSFSLEEKPAPNQISFSPGAMDGIGIFHAGKSNEKKATKKIVNLLKNHFKTGKDKYIVEIENILTNNRAISMIDAVLEDIVNDNKSIRPDSVLEASLIMIKTSNNVELVKIGIGLLGLLDLGDSEEVAEIVTTLGLYEDLTLYVIVAISNWTNGNSLIFKIAQKVSGWGKIHAVERLQPENEDIRKWILYYGCSNGVMDAYLGLICANKGNLISALRQKTLEEEMFDGISIIVNAMLDEGPVSGISEYQHVEEALMLFIRHAETYCSKVEHLWYMLNLRDWLESQENEYKIELIMKINEIINNPFWIDKICFAMKNRENAFGFFCACNTASRLDVDITAQLFEIVKDEPLKYYSYIPKLFKTSSMADELIKIYETILPLNDMADGMGDFIFADKLNQEHQCLDFVLQELAPYPLRGVKLIETGLNSRVVRGRNMACNALSSWVTMLGKPLADFSPELFAEILRIHKIEVSEGTKETMMKLIN